MGCVGSQLMPVADRGLSSLQCAACEGASVASLALFMHSLRCWSPFVPSSQTLAWLLPSLPCHGSILQDGRGPHGLSSFTVSGDGVAVSRGLVCFYVLLESDHLLPYITWLGRENIYTDPGEKRLGSNWQRISGGSELKPGS